MTSHGRTVLFKYALGIKYVLEPDGEIIDHVLAHPEQSAMEYLDALVEQGDPRVTVLPIWSGNCSTSMHA